MRIDDYRDRALIERLQTAVDNDKPHIPHKPTKLQIMMCKVCKWRSCNPYESGWCDYSLTHNTSNGIIQTGKCQVFEEGDRIRQDEHPWAQDNNAMIEGARARRKVRETAFRDEKDRRRREQ